MILSLKKILSLHLVLVSLFFTGCARHYPPRHPPQEPMQPELEQPVPSEPAQQRVIQEKDLSPGRQDGTRQEREETARPDLKPQKGPAQALYRDAQQALQQGQYKQAEMLLERALRIEPRNGWYWHAMGRVQYEQGSFDQAVQFTLKSDSLAGSDTDLKLQNRLLQEKVRKQTGNLRER